MKHPLLSLALTCLYLLHASAHVNVQPDFDITKFAGKWNVVALALNEGEPSEKNRFHTTVLLDNDGVITFKTLIPVETECIRSEIRFTPDEQPGIYSADQGKIYIMKTDYVSYAILFLHTRELEVLHLFVRGEDASTEEIEIFKEVATSINVSVDRIIHLQRSDSCTGV